MRYVPFRNPCVCFFVLCNRHWFNKDPGPDPRGTEMEVTYLPFAFSSDANCADLPLPLLGAPVDISIQYSVMFIRGHGNGVTLSIHPHRGSGDLGLRT